jgi:hypothetical protein
MGGSADRASDAKSAYKPASLAYTGIRVLRGAPKPAAPTPTTTAK